MSELWPYVFVGVSLGLDAAGWVGEHSHVAACGLIVGMVLAQARRYRTLHTGPVAR